MGGVNALLATTLAISSPAQSAILVGNYSAVDDGTFSAVQTGRSQKAVGFTIPNINVDYKLDQIVLRLSSYNTLNDVALLQIYSTTSINSNDPNEFTILEPVLFSTSSSSTDPNQNVFFLPTTTFTFLPNTSYWLLVDAVQGSFGWNAFSPPGIAPTGLVEANRTQYVFSDDNGVTYTGSTIRNTFQIDVTPVAIPPVAIPFEFNPVFGFSILGGLYAGSRYLKKFKAAKSKI
jgi:hypothetical protein